MCVGCICVAWPACLVRIRHVAYINMTCSNYETCLARWIHSFFLADCSHCVAMFSSQSAAQCTYCFISYVVLAVHLVQTVLIWHLNFCLTWVIDINMRNNSLLASVGDSYNYIMDHSLLAIVKDSHIWQKPSKNVMYITFSSYEKMRSPLSCHECFTISKCLIGWLGGGGSHTSNTITYTFSPLRKGCYHISNTIMCTLFHLWGRGVGCSQTWTFHLW